MREQASVLHIDLDAFFASVEQRDKPSLRAKPVVVGGTGGRGVVATASYEARAFGIHSAMSTREARARCPNAAFLSGRFEAYRETSRRVMALLREVTPVVEPLSLDEAFVDLEATSLNDFSVQALLRFGQELRARVARVTGGPTATVGIATSKFMAKVASELDKPDSITVVAPGTERALLRPMDVSIIPGVGPATKERLRRAGVRTIAELEQIDIDELVSLLGEAQGHVLWRLSRAQDDRPVQPERETKSVSVEGTYDFDVTDRTLMEGLLTRQAAQVGSRLRKQGISGRTVSIKVRMHDFTTIARSTTLVSPTDADRTIARLARAMLAEVDTAGGIRLLGVGVSSLADWVQDDLFPDDGDPEPESVPIPEVPRRTWPPGIDVEHEIHGAGWVWGSGAGIVTVRFETANTPPGPVKSLRIDDPQLSRRAP